LPPDARDSIEIDPPTLGAHQRLDAPVVAAAKPLCQARNETPQHLFVGIPLERVKLSRSRQVEDATEPTLPIRRISDALEADTYIRKSRECPPFPPPKMPPVKASIWLNLSFLRQKVRPSPRRGSGATPTPFAGAAPRAAILKLWSRVLNPPSSNSEIGPSAVSLRAGKPYGRWRLRDDPDLLHTVKSTLAATRPLQNVAPDLLRSVLEEAAVLRIMTGEYLIHEGSREVDTMYLLIDGAIEIVVGGRRIVLHDEPGETLGEISTINRQPRIADVRAQVDSVVVEVPVEPIFALRTTNPERYIRYLELIAISLGAKLSNATRHERQYAEQLLESENIRANNAELQKLVTDRLREVLMLSHVFRSSQDAILIANPDGTLLSANPTAIAWLKWETTQVDTVSLFARIPELQGMEGRLVDPLNGGFKTGLDISGTVYGDMPVELTFTPVVQEGQIIALAFFLRDIREQRSLLESLRQSQEQLLQYSKGLEQKVAERTWALRQSNIELQQINERLSQETRSKDAALLKLKETQSHLLQSEKMIALGRLAAGMAHEINNPIGYVTSNLHTLSEYLGQLRQLLEYYGELDDSAVTSREDLIKVEERVRKLKQEMDYTFVIADSAAIIADAMAGVKRVAAIVKNLKEFTHLEGAAREFCSLNENLDCTIKLIWNELKYKAKVVRQFGTIPEVECFPNQLNQAFLNILLNAVQAIDREGTITVSTSAVANEVLVRIADDGCGIAPEALPHIFEPFFTTKPVGSGMGLGLTSAYSIVRNHHGRIEAESAPGMGTVLSIYLPARQPATAQLGNL